MAEKTDRRQTTLEEVSNSSDETTEKNSKTESNETVLYYYFDTAGFSHLDAEEQIEEKLNEISDGNGLCYLTQHGTARQGTFGGDIYGEKISEIETFDDLRKLPENIVSENLKIIIDECRVVLEYESRGCSTVRIVASEVTNLNRETRKMMCEMIKSDISEKMNTSDVSFESRGFERFVEDIEYDEMRFEIPLQSSKSVYGDRYRIDADMRGVYNKLGAVFRKYGKYVSDFEILTPERIDSGIDEGKYRSDTVEVLLGF